MSDEQTTPETLSDEPLTEEIAENVSTENVDDTVVETGDHEEAIVETETDEAGIHVVEAEISEVAEGEVDAMPVSGGATVIDAADDAAANRGAADEGESDAGELDITEMDEEEIADLDEAGISALVEDAAPAERGIALANNKVSGPPEFTPHAHRGRSRRIRESINIGDLHYRNLGLIARFLDRRGRILSRRKTGVSAKLQRRLVSSVKKSRHLALLPYTGEHIRVTNLHKRR